MADHYDVPPAGGWKPPVLVRSPNLGQPRLVEPRPGAPLRFVVAVLDPETDVREALDGRLFLQALPDTRRILQDAATPARSIGDLSPADCPRLVSLTVDRVDGIERSAWPWGRNHHEATTYPYARWVTVRLPRRLPPWVQADTLYNVVHDFPDVGWYNVNFHAVYLREGDWDDFAVMQISDTHVAWRNDTIVSVLESRFPGIGKRFVNFNRNLRDFVSYANARHRAGALDLIVLTGDIVDFVFENFTQRWKRERAGDLLREPNYPRPIDNFELFRDLIVAWESHPGMVIGDELEVPLFTVPGNHDYRLNEYPLIHQLHIDVGGIDLSSLHPDPIREYSTFDLTEDEACAYEGGLQEIDDSTAATFVEYDSAPPVSYRALVNPDADFVVELGRHRLVGLDTGHDDGVVSSIVEYLFRSGSGKMFIEGSPNSVGFSAEQIAFLRTQVDATDGLLFVACHAPLVNMRGTPNHLLREAEHNRAFTEKEKAEVAAFVLANRPEATELEQYWPVAAGGGNLLLTGDPITSGVIAGLGYAFKWLSGDPSKGPIDKLRDDGWLFGGTRVMKVGDRDPYLAWGVAANRFRDFIGAIESRPGAGTTATLVLTGHTHQSIEYVVSYRGGDVRLMRYYHDYYLDNTIHGRRPQGYWCSEQIPDSAEVTDPQVLWHRKSPLLVQTMSLGPKPSSQKPDEQQALPYGAAAVRAGRFALYDLTAGTYVAHFVSGDRRCSAVGMFDVPGEQPACGKAEITLRLIAQQGVVRPLTDKQHPPAAFSSRDLDVGLDITVDGWVKPLPGTSGPSGTVFVAKAPRPVGGALHVTVAGGEITEMRRITLAEMDQPPESLCRADVVEAAALAVSLP